jgi:hypothetical protein
MPDSVTPDPANVLPVLLRLHEVIREGVVEACAAQSQDALTAVAADDEGDTIYAIDRVSEELIVDGLAPLAAEQPLCLVMEGLPGGVRILPDGASESDCVWRIIADPIDGTRGLMYQKRSAWILTGVAPNRGPETRLRDIVLAVQTEIPLLKQHLSDQLWAFREREVQARRYDRLRGMYQPLPVTPSRARSIAHGVTSVSRFFPGARDVLAAIDEEIVRDALGRPQPGKALCFEDQYAATGGQLYELMVGHDRFVADLRPLLQPVYAERGLPAGLACHPYDICTALIAEQLGVLLTDGRGQTLDAPLNVEADVAWAGYANADIRAQVEPALHRALDRRGLLNARD